MLKNQSPLTLALALMMSLSFTSGAFALNYSNRQGNKATFETLEETRVSSPAAAASQGSGKGNFKSHTVLDGYPKGTTYVYRSANLWGGRDVHFYGQNGGAVQRDGSTVHVLNQRL